MSNIHDLLARILQEHCQPGERVTTRQLRQWSEQDVVAASRERLFPAHHARSQDGSLPLCVRCQSQPLLEKVYPRPGGHPVYQVLRTEAEPLPSDHQLLARALKGFSGQLLTLATIRALLLESFEREGSARPGLLRSIHRHTSGNFCQTCDADGPLLERFNRQQYRIREPGESLPTVPQEVTFSLTDVLELAREGDALDLLMPGLHAALLGKGHSEQAARALLTSASARQLEASLKQGHLLICVWQSRDPGVWQTAEATYLRHVRHPELEALLDTLLPQRVMQDPASIQVQALLEFFLDWYLGQRPALAADYQQRLAKLKQPRNQPLVLPSSVLSDLKSANSLKQALTDLSALPGMAPAQPADLSLATGLLALLRPDACLTVSRPVLWALRLLASEGLLPQDLPLQATEPDDLVQLILWAQGFCHERNTGWQEPWLTPHRLDRLLYALRDFGPDLLARYVKGKALSRLSDQLDSEQIQLTLAELFLAPKSSDVQTAQTAWQQWCSRTRSAILLELALQD